MKSKKDPAEYDGLSTLVDAPPEDLEEQATEQWASAADVLFARQQKGQPQQNRWEGIDGEDLDGTDFEAHLSALSAPLPRQGDTLLDVPLDKVLTPEAQQAARVALKIDTEELRTNRDSTLSDALLNDEESDTVEMSPEEAAAAIRSAQASLQAALDKQSAAQPGSGRAETAVAAPEVSDPGGRTVMVKGSAGSSSMTYQCRLCGRSIARPQPVHFRGSAASARGFRCERCHNLVCAAHAVRISSFWESLFKQGRFCCSLCQPSGAPSDKLGST